MEITMDYYDLTIGYKYIDIVDVKMMINEAMDYRSEWRYRTLYPTHGTESTYQGVYYRTKAKNAVLYKSSFPQDSYMVFKMGDRYWKLTDEISKARLNYINSFLDMTDDNFCPGLQHFTMKQWKEIPTNKPFIILRSENEISYQIAETAADPPVSTEDDELPFY